MSCDGKLCFCEIFMDISKASPRQSPRPFTHGATFKMLTASDLVEIGPVNVMAFCSAMTNGRKLFFSQIPTDNSKTTPTHSP
jgi:hypothetical protein